MTLALALAFFSSGMASPSLLVNILSLLTMPAWFALIVLSQFFGMTTGWLNLPSNTGILFGIASCSALAYLVCRWLRRLSAP
jgi:hypothetical protein